MVCPGTDQRDRGDVVIGWLARIVIVLTVVAVLGYDGIQVTMAKVNSQSTANSAAAAGRDNFTRTRDVHQALAAARANADSSHPGDVIPAATFKIAKDGSVTLQLSEPIKTIVLHRFPSDFLRTSTATGIAEPDPGTEINPRS
jgi:hypothetical protein